jgi:flagellin-like hook-associated protein FlgL
MADVVLSGAMRSNLLSMQNTAKLLDQTQQRVATGLKVSTAVDNPQSYFTAQGLNNRASDLSQLLDSMGLAVQTLNAASQGIDAIQKLVQQAKAAANQALQTTVMPATTTSAVVPTDYTSAANSGLELTFTIGDGDATSIVLTTNITSAGDLKTALSGQISGLTVSVTTGGEIKFSVDSGDNFTVSGSAVGTAIAADVTTTNGVNRNKQVDNYNALLDQIDNLAQDASFNGINLLQSGSNLLVNFNENQTSQLSIDGSNTSSTGIGLERLTYEDFATNTALKAVQEADDRSLQKLRVASTAFASSLSVVQSRQDFTKNMINTLQTGASGLTLADTNEEGANLLALQTRQQLGTSALSIANQSQQSILKLF